MVSGSFERGRREVVSKGLRGSGGLIKGKLRVAFQVGREVL